MASLSGVSGSNTISSLMNSANMISGLASGMDTEGMIEQLVKSYQMKINQYNQKITKVEWKQDAYRSIISKMVALADKYTSYTSSTNLLSRSFFSSAVTVSSLGKYADAVSAIGKTSSDIAINSVQQLATAAKYRTQSNLDYGDGKSIKASGNGIDLNGKTTLGSLSGSMTLTYGSQKITISFDQVADVKAMDEIRSKLAEEKNIKAEDVESADVLAGLINQKLSGQTINLSGGKTANATDRISVIASDGQISFSDKSTAGNSVFISDASGNVAATLGITAGLKEEDVNKPRSFEFFGDLTYKENNANYLSGRSMNLNLDGVTKSVNMPRIYSRGAVGEDGETTVEYYLKDDDGNELEYNAKNYTKLLNNAVEKAFGGKVTVTNALVGTEGYDEETSSQLKLNFTMRDDGSSLVINTNVGDALGIGRSATSYLNTSKTLGDVMGDKLEGLTSSGTDEDGNPLYDFVINGVKVGSYSKDTKLSDLMNDINKSAAGVKVSYSQTTKNFLFEATETGRDSKVELGGGLAKAMFSVPVSDKDKVSDVFEGVEEGQTLWFKIPGGNVASFAIKPGMTMDDVIQELNESMFSVEGYTFSYDKNTGKIVADDGERTLDVIVASKVHYEEIDGGKHKQLVIDEEAEYKNASRVSYTKGQDAIFNVTVNGETINMTRSSNTVNIDGLSITMKEEFEAEKSSDAVTFKTSTDSDKIVDVIKDLVNDYNTVMAEIKSAYGTMPYQNSNGSFGNFEPLTEEEMEGMSESAIARYEEKAKQGILFGDRTLSTLYDKLNRVFSFSNKTDVDTLKDMGITVSYSISGGTQAVTIDEKKLRAMLDSDPDRVADLFTKDDGVMDRMKTQLDNYARTTGEPKGILIQQAGSPLSSLSLLNNFWQQEIDNSTTQIEKWQTKLESQVERYTRQFARMEQLIAQMNSQSSTLSGLMGGY